MMMTRSGSDSTTRPGLSIAGDLHLQLHVADVRIPSLFNPMGQDRPAGPIARPPSSRWLPTPPHRREPLTGVQLPDQLGRSTAMIYVATADIYVARQTPCPHIANVTTLAKVGQLDLIAISVDRGMEVSLVSPRCSPSRSLTAATSATFPLVRGTSLTKPGRWYRRRTPIQRGTGGDVGYYLNTDTKIDDAGCRLNTAYKRVVGAEEYVAAGKTLAAIDQCRKDLRSVVSSLRIRQSTWTRGGPP